MSELAEEILNFQVCSAEEHLVRILLAIEGEEVSVHVFEFVLELLEITSKSNKADASSKKIDDMFYVIFSLLEKANMKIRVINTLNELIRSNSMILHYAKEAEWLTRLLEILPNFEDRELLDGLFVLFENLATYHTSVRQVKLIFRLFQSENAAFIAYYWEHIFPLLENLWHRSGLHPDTYFEFDGECSKILLPNFQYSSTGYTLTIMFKSYTFTSSSIQDKYQPYLFSFYTNDGLGLEVFWNLKKKLTLTMHRLSEGDSQQVSFDYEFQTNTWYLVTFVHLTGMFKPDTLILYVNDQCVSEHSFKYYKPSQSFTLSHVGTCAMFPDEEHTLRGQISGMFLLDDVINVKQVQSIYKLGFNLFKSRDLIEARLREPSGRQSGISRPRFVLFVTPCLTSGSNCSWNVHTNSVCMFDDFCRVTLLDVRVCQTASFAMSLLTAGGVRLFLPLFSSQFRPQASEQVDVNNKIIAFITQLLNEYYRNEMYRTRFFEFMGYLLATDFNHATKATRQPPAAEQGSEPGLDSQSSEKSNDGQDVDRDKQDASHGFDQPPHKWSTKSIVLLDNLARVLDEGSPGTPVSIESNGLLNQFFLHVYLNFQIWHAAEYNVQKLLIESLLNRVRLKPRYFYSIISITQITLILRQYYSYLVLTDCYKSQHARPFAGSLKPARPQKINSLIANFSGQSHSKLLDLRQLFLNIVALFYELKLDISVQETQAIIEYLYLEMQNERHTKACLVDDVLDTILNILHNSATVLSAHLVQIGGIDVFLPLLQLRSESTRVFALKVIGKLVQLCSADRGRTPASQDLQFSALQESLERYPLTTSIYNVLLEMILGSVSPTSIANPVDIALHPKTDPKQIPTTIKHTRLIAMTFEIINRQTGSAGPRDAETDDRNRAAELEKGDRDEDDEVQTLRGGRSDAASQPPAAASAIGSLDYRSGLRLKIRFLEDILFYLKKNSQNCLEFMKLYGWQSWVLQFCLHPGEHRAAQFGATQPQHREGYEYVSEYDIFPSEIRYDSSSTRPDYRLLPPLEALQRDGAQKGAPHGCRSRRESADQCACAAGDPVDHHSCRKLVSKLRSLVVDLYSLILETYFVYPDDSLHIFDMCSVAFFIVSYRSRRLDFMELACAINQKVATYLLKNNNAEFCKTSVVYYRACVQYITFVQDILFTLPLQLQHISSGLSTPEADYFLRSSSHLQFDGTPILPFALCYDASSSSWTALTIAQLVLDLLDQLTQIHRAANSPDSRITSAFKSKPERDEFARLGQKTSDDRFRVLCYLLVEVTSSIKFSKNLEDRKDALRNLHLLVHGGLNSQRASSSSRETQELLQQVLQRYLKNKADTWELEISGAEQQFRKNANHLRNVIKEEALSARQIYLLLIAKTLREIVYSNAERHLKATGDVLEAARRARGPSELNRSASPVASQTASANKALVDYLWNEALDVVYDKIGSSPSATSDSFFSPRPEISVSREEFAQSIETAEELRSFVRRGLECVLSSEYQHASISFANLEATAALHFKRTVQIAKSAKIQRDQWLLRQRQLTEQILDAASKSLKIAAIYESQYLSFAESEWKNLLRTLTDASGLWATKESARNTRVYWKLDSTETTRRMRIRLRRQYGDASDVPQLSAAPGDGSSRPKRDKEELSDQKMSKYLRNIASRLRIRVQRLKNAQFSEEIAAFSDLMYASMIPCQPSAKLLSADGLLSNFGRDQILLSTPCEYICGIESHLGEFELTTRHIHFRDTSSTIFKTWLIDSIETVYSRYFMLQSTALEIFTTSKSGYFFNFLTEKPAAVLKHILAQKPAKLFEYFVGHPMSLMEKKKHLTDDWRKRKISNFDYLMALNTIAGRSYNDITQYPIFPWVISDYNSETIDLDDPRIYRDLSKPIGALNPERLEKFLQRWKSMCEDEEQTIPPFLYGSHYSTHGAVLYYMIRVAPFTAQALRFQGGTFDLPARTFWSISETWNNCLHNPTDVKELIPEFYFLPEMLINVNQLQLGQPCTNSATSDQKDPEKKEDTCHHFAPLFNNDVVLPPWASSAYTFIQANRLALESEYVSNNLHHWIDLIFGFKQTGECAVDAHNVFYYLSYEKNVNLDDIKEPLLRKSVQMQIREFGQTPSQLFKTPHVTRCPKSEAQSTEKKTITEMVSHVLMSNIYQTSSKKQIPDPSLTLISHKPLVSSAEWASVLSAHAVNNENLIVAIYRDGTVLPVQIKSTKKTGSKDQHSLAPLWNAQQGADYANGKREFSVGNLFFHQGETPVKSVADPKLPTKKKASRKFFKLKKHQTTDDQRSTSNYGSVDQFMHRSLSIQPHVEPCSPTDKLLPSALFAITSDGKFLIHGGHWDRSVRLYQLGSHLIPVACSFEHKHIVTCVAISEDNRTLVTGSCDCNVYVWDLSFAADVRSAPNKRAKILSRLIVDFGRQKPRLVLSGHEDAVSAVAVRPDLDVVVTASRDSTCILYNLRKGSYYCTIRYPSPVALVRLSCFADVLAYCSDSQQLFLHTVNGVQLCESHLEVEHMEISSCAEWIVLAHKQQLQVRSLVGYQLQLIHCLTLKDNIQALCLTLHDQYLVVGLSSGHLRLVPAGFKNYPCKISKALYKQPSINADTPSQINALETPFHP